MTLHVISMPIHTFLSRKVETICRSCSHGRYPGREEDGTLGSVTVCSISIVLSQLCIVAR